MPPVATQTRSLAEHAANANRALLPVAALGALVALIDVSDWNEGVTRAAALALGGCAIAALWRTPLPPLPRRSRRWLAVAAVAVILQLAHAWPQLTNPRNRPNDIGTTTQAAIHALQHRQSIYRARIDDQYGPGEGFHHFAGYKYGPVVPRFYYQFMRVFGESRGLYAANAALLALAALAAGLLAARAAGGSAAAAIATIVVLFWPRMVHFELFVQGVNDLLPTSLVVLALLGCAFERPVVAGVALGLSLACKPLPGALLLPLLPWRTSARRLAIGLALGLLTMVPDFVRAPREMLANLVLFNFGRPGDSTSLLQALPTWAQPVVQLAGLALIAAVVVVYQRGRAETTRLICAAACVVTIFLVISKIIHRNYVLWWLPLVAAAVGATCYRPAATSDMSRP